MTEETKQPGKEHVFTADAGEGPIWRWRGRARKGEKLDVIFRYDGACRTASACVWNREDRWHWLILEGDGEPACGTEASSHAAIMAAQVAHSDARPPRRATTRDEDADRDLLLATTIGKGGSVRVQLDELAAQLSSIAIDVRELCRSVAALEKAARFEDGRRGT